MLLCSYTLDISMLNTDSVLFKYMILKKHQSFETFDAIKCHALFGCGKAKLVFLWLIPELKSAVTFIINNTSTNNSNNDMKTFVIYKVPYMT